MMYLPTAGMMRHHLKIFVLLVAASFVTSRPSQAQASNATRALWTAWLGCWAPERPNAGTSAPAPAKQSTVTCIDPVDGSRAVDEMTLVADTVIAYRRWPLPTTATRSFTEQGCRGREAASWSASGRRAYVHAEYTCEDGGRGASASLLAFLPSGVWLRVSEVRAGGG